MTDIVITANALASTAGSRVINKAAGEAITAGQVVYLKNDNKVYKSLATATGGGKNTILGVALTSGTVGTASAQISVQTTGNLNLGSGVGTAGTIYVLSNATGGGGIAPASDLQPNWVVDVLGVSTSSSTIQMNVWNSGVTHL